MCLGMLKSLASVVTWWITQFYDPRLLTKIESIVFLGHWTLGMNNMHMLGHWTLVMNDMHMLGHWTLGMNNMYMELVIGSPSDVQDIWVAHFREMAGERCFSFGEL